MAGGCIFQWVRPFKSFLDNLWYAVREAAIVGMERMTMKLRNALLAAGAVAVVLAVALASQKAVTQQAPLKLGVVDLDLLVKNYDGTKEAQKKIDAEGDKWVTRIKALETDHQEMVAKLSKDRTFLEDAEIRNRQRAISAKAGDVEAAQIDGREAMLKMQSELLDPILLTAEKAIQKYGEEHDYDIMFQRRTTLVYHKPKFDATNQIVQIMNAELKAAGEAGGEATDESVGEESGETTGESAGEESSETTAETAETAETPPEESQ